MKAYDRVQSLSEKMGCRCEISAHLLVMVLTVDSCHEYYRGTTSFFSRLHHVHAMMMMVCMRLPGNEDDLQITSYFLKLCLQEPFRMS
jgi:hypothetical protein